MTEHEPDIFAARRAWFEAYRKRPPFRQFPYQYTCFCCGYPYFYWDPDFFDPCPICLWPALGVLGDESDDADDGSSPEDPRLPGARRRYREHGYAVPPQHPLAEEARRTAEARAAIAARLDRMQAAAEPAEQERLLKEARAAYTAMERAERARRQAARGPA